MEKMVTYRYNMIKIHSPESFARVRGRFHESRKDVYFVRMLGRSADFDAEVVRMDDSLCRQMQEGRLYFRRVKSLPVLSDSKEIAYYTKCYERWMDAKQEGICTKISKGKLAVWLCTALEQTMRYYLNQQAAVSDSMQKNFAVKLIYWFDIVCSGLQHWSESSCIKIVAENIEKTQHYLFYYFLTLLGCDVLLLQSESDAIQEELKNLSEEVKIGPFGKQKIPEYVCAKAAEKTTAPHDTKKTAAAVPYVKKEAVCEKRQVKTFEQLAALASSVVLIGVHKKDGQLFATGSGIMVGRSGYILTNDHVTRGGYCYSVRIENDDQVYETDELIKYNPMLDLALLRIERRLDPLPIYDGSKKLARGQAVAAIGSPLGMFNSVSDGIISGFRSIDGVDMIQFTAPISKGSSGGAVLNMYGEVIGISTAGFDRGQNMNLAVGYENIQMFIKGFQS